MSTKLYCVLHDALLAHAGAYEEHVETAHDGRLPAVHHVAGGVYLAARVTRREEMRQYAAELRERTRWVSTSRWVDHAWSDRRADEDHAARHQRCATGDFEDVDRADVVVVFATPDGWGHAVELGYAWAQDKEIVLVESDPDFDHVFAHLPGVTRVADWSDALDLLVALDPGAADVGSAEDGPLRADRVGESQPLPTADDGTCVVCGLELHRGVPRPDHPFVPDVQAYVQGLLDRRRRLGIARYGSALRPHNGRSALVDLLEELVDATSYCAQKLLEDDVEAARALLKETP